MGGCNRASHAVVHDVCSTTMCVVLPACLPACFPRACACGDGIRVYMLIEQRICVHIQSQAPPPLLPSDHWLHEPWQRGPPTALYPLHRPCARGVHDVPSCRTSTARWRRRCVCYGGSCVLLACHWSGCPAFYAPACILPHDRDQHLPVHQVLSSTQGRGGYQPHSGQGGEGAQKTLPASLTGPACLQVLSSMQGGGGASAANLAKAMIEVYSQVRV